MQWENENFIDIPEQDNSYQESQELVQYEDEYVEELEANSLEEDPLSLTQEEESLLGTAMIRLDQARLYEMLVKHDLFEGVQANPIALKAVQKEIKSFIMDRLEILLGLKVDKHIKSNTQGQFNDLEVQALKDLAFAATKGATRQQRETPKPVNSTQQYTGLKPLTAKPKINLNEPPMIQASKVLQKPAQQQKVIQKKTLKSKKTNEDIPLLTKNINEMSSEELLERTKLTSDIYKGRTAVNKEALLPPSFEQQMMQYSSVLSGNGNGIGSDLMKKLGGNGVYDAGSGE